MGVAIFIIVVVIILFATSSSSKQSTSIETETQRQDRLRREQSAREAEQRTLEQRQKAQAEREQQQRLALRNQQLKANRLALQEVGTDYSRAIVQVMQPFPKLWSIYEYNISATSHLGSSEILNCLSHGVTIINSAQQALCYMTAYAGMHYHKLQTSFTTLFSQLPSNSKIDIIDYGCGQALATTALYDYSIRYSRSIEVDRVVLIEPSDVVLRRGILNLNYFIDFKNQNTEVIKINKSLDQIIIGDLRTNDANIKVHLFSNILDVQGFNYNQLASRITNTQKGLNYFICVSPNNGNASTRINGFQNCFNQTNITCHSGSVSGKNFRVIGRCWKENDTITIVQRIFKCNF